MAVRILCRCKRKEILNGIKWPSYLFSAPNFTANASLTSPSSRISTKELIINERHRHGYEVSPAYVETLNSYGLHFIGKDDKGECTETLELKDYPWFVGVQFHPEYLSLVLGA
jgi:CTP synthase